MKMSLHFQVVEIYFLLVLHFQEFFQIIIDYILWFRWTYMSFSGGSFLQSYIYKYKRTFVELFIFPSPSPLPLFILRKSVWWVKPMAKCPWNITPFLSFPFSIYFLKNFLLILKAGRGSPREVRATSSVEPLCQGVKLNVCSFVEPESTQGINFRSQILEIYCKVLMAILSFLWMYINKCMCPIITILMKGLGLSINSLKKFFFSR